VIAAFIGFGSLAADPAFAQPLTSLEFSFSNPGARSLGFGGAFVALADDATAAFANPAGIVQIAKPELSLEGRAWSYSRIIESLLPQQRDAEDFLEDADEIHLGGEYAFFVGTSVWAIRAGAWHDPDHYFGSRSSEPVIRAITVPGEDQLHLALGCGVALRRLQIDIGVDLSERIDTASLSVIYSFSG
jgi:hypothetical protein